MFSKSEQIKFGLIYSLLQERFNLMAFYRGYRGIHFFHYLDSINALVYVT